MIILDTCTLVWMTNCPEELSKAAAKAIRANADALCVLPISAWEIAMKIKGGKLAVGGTMSAGEWYEKVVNSYGLREIPLTAELLCASVQLPPVHRDPCDREAIEKFEEIA